MSERDVSEGVLEQSQGFPATPPGATCPCKMPKKLHAGVFFDGTNNNKSRDKPKGKHTNVVRLYDVYREFADADAVRRKCYFRGVGSIDTGERTRQLGQEVRGSAAQHVTRSPSLFGLGMAAGSALAKTGGYVADLGYDLAGKVGGAGGKTRLNMAYFWLRDRCKEIQPTGERTVDIFGFSRGAAIARTFVNLVNQGLKREQPLLKVRFLGIFDTVGSFGIPGDESDPGENLGIDTLDAMAISHFTARHEYRQNFPLTRTPASDTPYVGCHSDVGGSYPPVDDDKKVNHIVYIPFVDMHAAALRAKVELSPAAPQIAGGVDVEALRKKTVAEAPADARLVDPKVHWSPAQKAFYDKYMHQSHTTPSDWWLVNQAKRMNPNHLDNSGWRRVFTIRRQGLTALPPNFKWK